MERQKREQEQDKAQLTEMPLDFLLRTMRSPETVPVDRMAAARAAAPYCHAQLQAVAHQWPRPCA